MLLYCSVTRMFTCVYLLYCHLKLSVNQLYWRKNTCAYQMDSITDLELFFLKHNRKEIFALI